MRENAKTRRHLRRALDAIRRRSTELACVIKILGNEHPQCSPESKRNNSLSQLANDRICKAVDTQTEYHKQIIQEAAKYPDYRANPQFMKIGNEAGRQIHAIQKRNHF